MTHILSVLVSVTTLAVLFVAAPAQAAVIFDNGGPDGTAARASDTSFGTSGVEAADDFSLTAGQTTIRDVHWWGLYIPGNTPPATDIFTMRIYNDASGEPGSLAATSTMSNVTRTDTGLDFSNGADIYAFSATVSDTSLTASTTYWLSIMNDTTTDTNDDWFWMGTSGPGNSKLRTLPNGAWNNGNIDFDLAFNLTDDVPGNRVPEPSTLLLLGGGMIGLGWLRRRKR